MKRFKIRFIKEEAITQDATKPADVSFAETQSQSSDNAQQEQIPIKFIDDEQGLEEQDVDNMTDGAVLSTMLNPNAEVDDVTTQALGDRANDLVTRLSTNTITPDEKKQVSDEFVTNVKTAQQTGFAESFLWDEMETEILNSLNESLNEYDYSDKGDFVEFAFSLGYEVAERLRQDAGMTPENRNDKVWGLVSDWMEANSDAVKQLWFKKSPYSGYDPSESDILVVKKQVLPEFLKKFGK